MVSILQVLHLQHKPLIDINLPSDLFHMGSQLQSQLFFRHFQTTSNIKSSVFQLKVLSQHLRYSLVGIVGPASATRGSRGHRSDSEDSSPTLTPKAMTTQRLIDRGSSTQSSSSLKFRDMRGPEPHRRTHSKRSATRESFGNLRPKINSESLSRVDGSDSSQNRALSKSDSFESLSSSNSDLTASPSEFAEPKVDVLQDPSLDLKNHNTSDRPIVVLQQTRRKLHIEQPLQAPVVNDAVLFSAQNDSTFRTQQTHYQAGLQSSTASVSNRQTRTATQGSQPASKPADNMSGPTFQPRYPFHPSQSPRQNDGFAGPIPQFRRHERGFVGFDYRTSHGRHPQESPQSERLPSDLMQRPSYRSEDAHDVYDTHQPRSLPTQHPYYDDRGAYDNPPYRNRDTQRLQQLFPNRFRGPSSKAPPSGYDSSRRSYASDNSQLRCGFEEYEHAPREHAYARQEEFVAPSAPLPPQWSPTRVGGMCACVYTYVCCWSWVILKMSRANGVARAPNHGTRPLCRSV